MNTNPHILPLIARSGIAEDDLLEFIEGELPVERSAEVLAKLSDHPELRDAVFAMRADRGDLSHELVMIPREPDHAFVESVVHQGVTGEFDPEFAARMEAIGGGSLVRMRRPRSVRHRRLRLPVGAVGGLLAACVAVAFFGAVWAAWPASPPPRPTLSAAPAQPDRGALAGGTADAATDAPALASAGDNQQSAPGDGLSNERLRDRDRGWAWGSGDTETILTPAEALAAAHEGRLVIRVYSPDAAAGRALVESITMSPSVSRVAVLEGRLDDLAAERVAAAIPVPTGPVYAGDPATVRESDRDDAGRASWVYMLEVEPTERGVSLLLAGLSREPGMLVELLRSHRPVTTPGSADDVSWFRKPSRDWTRRIAAPVVVQSSER